MSIIAAGTSSGTALVSTGDTNGTLVIQTNGTTVAATFGTDQKLTLAGALVTTGVSTFAAGSAAAPSITTTGDTNTGVFFPAADTIGFSEGGAEAVRIDSDGDVGIGTSTPTNKLHVSSSSFETIKLQGTSTVSGINFVNSASSNGYIYYDNGPNMLFYTNGTEQMRIDSSGNFKFNSGYGSVATAFGCRAWVNFNGQGTIAITGSGNVSSLTDIAAGKYNVNLTTAMPDTVYSVVTGITKGGGGPSASNSAWSNAGELRSTSYFLLEVYDWNFTAFDSAFVQAAIFR